MVPLTSLWRWATENRATSLSASAGAVVLGVLIIAIGGIQDWGWTRVIGAGIISVGAVVFGVLVGWSEPVRPRIASALREWRRSIVVALTAIMVGPLLIGSLISFGGLFGGDDAGSGVVLVLGAAMIFLMLALIVGTVGLALTLALRGLEQTTASDAADGNGREDA